MSKKKITQAQLKQIIREELKEMDLQEAGPFGQRTMRSLLSTAQQAAGRAAKKDHKTITQLTKSTEGSPPKPPVKKPVYKKGTGGDFDEKPDDKPLVRVDKGPGKGIVTGEETVGGNIAYSSRERPGTMSGGKKSPMTNVGHTPVEPKNLDQIQQGVKGYPKSQQEHKEWSSYEGDQKLFENWRKFTGESK